MKADMKRKKSLTEENASLKKCLQMYQENVRSTNFYWKKLNYWIDSNFDNFPHKKVSGLAP